MQIPCRLHVIEAPNAFSKIRFLKELPVCSTIRGKNVAEFAFSFQLRILSSFPCLREPAEQANTPLLRSSHGPRAPQTVKREIAEIHIWSAFRPFVHVFFSLFWFSGGSKTTKEVFKMVPRHVSDSPRRTQDGPRRRQDSQDGSKALLRRPKTDPKSTKIHGKLMLRAIPISVSFFVRFLIDFQSIFRP